MLSRMARGLMDGFKWIMVMIGTESVNKLFYFYFLCFQITAPFLHITVVGIVTLLSWVISGQWAAISNKCRLHLHAL